MTDKEHSITTEETTPLRSHKILCTKCEKTFPNYQFDFHYEHCGKHDDYVIYHPYQQSEH